MDKRITEDEKSNVFETRRNKNLIIMNCDEEPEFEISDELYSAVFDNMPADITELDTKALYVYAKLCLLLEYDSEFAYWDKVYDEEYPNEFSEERLKKIKPGSKIICQDFSRILAKMINELGDGIDAVILKKTVEKRGHWLVGVKKGESTFTLDSTYASTEDINDLANVKMIYCPTGLEDTTVDRYLKRKNNYENQLEKMIYLVNEYKETGVALLGDYKIIEKEFEQKVEAFSEMIKSHDLKGSELAMVFLSFEKASFFGYYYSELGSSIEKVFLLKKYIVSGKEKYGRQIYFRSKDDLSRNNQVYCIDTENGDIFAEKYEDIKNKIVNGELMYEDEEHTLNDWTRER